LAERARFRRVSRKELERATAVPGSTPRADRFAASSLRRRGSSERESGDRLARRGIVPYRTPAGRTRNGSRRGVRQRARPKGLRPPDYRITAYWEASVWFPAPGHPPDWGVGDARADQGSGLLQFSCRCVVGRSPRKGVLGTRRCSTRSVSRQRDSRIASGAKHDRRGGTHSRTSGRRRDAFGSR